MVSEHIELIRAAQAKYKGLRFCEKGKSNKCVEVLESTPALLSSKLAQEIHEFLSKKEKMTC